MPSSGGADGSPSSGGAPGSAAAGATSSSGASGSAAAAGAPSLGGAPSSGGAAGAPASGGVPDAGGDGGTGGALLDPCGAIACAYPRVCIEEGLCGLPGCVRTGEYGCDYDASPCCEQNYVICNPLPNDTSRCDGVGGMGSGTGGVPGGGSGGSGDVTGGIGGGGGMGGASGGTGGVQVANCPGAPPPEGSACTDASTSPYYDCAWGDDPRPGCRTTAACRDGAWALTTPPAFCADPPLNPACPDASPADGSACSDASVDCWYPDGSRCWCSDCLGGSAYPLCSGVTPPEWACRPPEAGCPYPLPNAGEPCGAPRTCATPHCATLPGEAWEAQIVCAEGSWQWQPSSCPRCASPDTLVATPAGERPIATLRVGDLVYSEHDAAVVAVPILRTHRQPVTGHRVVRVEVEGGAVLEMSAGHPTARGRRFAELRPGDDFDGRHTVRAVELIPYRHEATYDILPASSTGTYFASGAQVGSTLD